MNNSQMERYAIGTPPSGGAVLVYEDDEICAQAFASVLRRAGHTVQIANHFQPALAALETEIHVDVLLADLVFPDGGVNGLALARMALIKCPGLRVIHTTGYDLGNVTRAASGPILRKPVPDDALLFWVRRAFANGHGFWWL